MSKLFNSILAITTLGLSSVFANEKPSQVPDPNHVQGQIIVKLTHEIQFQKNGEFLETGYPSIDKKLKIFKINSARKIFPHHNGRIKDGVTDLSKIYELTFPKELDEKYIASIFEKDANFIYAEPRFIYHTKETPNDPNFQLGQPYLTTKLQVEEAWDIIKSEDATTPVILAIVDSGVDLDHPDLQANLWTNDGEIANNGIDDDNNGYVDDTVGWDFTGNSSSNPGANPDNDPNDQFGHGTHVSGDAAAVTNNNTGIAGIAWNPKIMAVKTGANSTAIFHGYEGIVYAVENGAQIINCSWGGSGGSQFGFDTIEFAKTNDVAVVAAAGNDSSLEPHFPSSYPTVLSVVATNNSYSKAGYSNFGIDADISCPGTSISSTTIGGGYGSQSGTSMASPIVAGAVCLVRALNPTWSAMQVLEQVRASADSALYIVNPSGNDYLMGKGGLNALRAVSLRTPAIRINEIEFDDTVNGDGDGILDPGESIDLNLELFNYLADAQNVSVGIVSSSPYVSITTQTTNVGNIDSLNSATATLSFDVNANAPKNAEVQFRVTYEATTSFGYNYYDFEHFAAFTRPNFVTHSNDSLQLSVTDEGNLGHVDNAGENGGVGFIFENGTDLMFEGAMIIARSANQVADAARTSGSNPQSVDFGNFGSDIFLNESSAIADQESDVTFSTMANAPLTGLDIRQRGFSFSQAPDNKFVILHYEITNTTSQPLNDVYVGYYFDWDVDSNNFGTNQVGFDAANNLGYTYDNNFPVYAGISVLNPEGVHTHRAISNQNDLFDTQGFTDSEKYQFISEGLVNATSSVQEDQSESISTGSFNILPNETIIASFAILGGNGLAELQGNALAAVTKYQTILPLLTSIKNTELSLPSQFELSNNFPNPFNPTTVINYQLPLNSKGKLAIFNILGKKVKEFDLTETKGNVVWNGIDSFGNPVSSGTYFYQLESGKKVQTKKMTLVK